MTESLSDFFYPEHQKTSKVAHCSAEITVDLHNHLIFLAALNISLSITAFLWNILILLALRKESASLHPPSKLLYRNLAITDLCVGIIVQPLAVVYWISVVYEAWSTCYYAHVAVSITGKMLCLVSLIILTAISVDRLLALLLGFKYQRVVTRKRAYITVAIIWVLSLAGLFSYVIVFILASLCMITSTFSYTKIFHLLRHYQIQVHGHASQRQPSQVIPLNIDRYRKAVYSALWVQIALIICYLPHFIAESLIRQNGLTSSFYLAGQFTVTLVLLNSSLNPLLYCWKIREVRQAVKDTLRQRFSYRAWL